MTTRIVFAPTRKGTLTPAPRRAGDSPLTVMTAAASVEVGVTVILLTELSVLTV